MFDRFGVTRCLRMISTGNHKPCLRDSLSETIESVDHELKTLVGSPFSECKNSMYRSAAHREVGKFRTPGKNSVRAQMDVIASVFVVQNLAISGHQDRYGVGEQKHACRHRACHAIEPLMTNTSIGQLNSIH